MGDKSPKAKDKAKKQGEATKNKKAAAPKANSTPAPAAKKGK